LVVSGAALAPSQARALSMSRALETSLAIVSKLKAKYTAR
jgi:hypothetical protein